MEVSNNSNVDLFLIEAAKNGDPKAFEEIVSKYKQAIYYTILKIVHNRDDAEDLTMVSFSKAFQSLHLYSSYYAFSSWLFKIATNNSIDFVRRKKTIVSTTLSASATDSEKDDIQPLTIRDTSNDPEASLIKNEKTKRLREMVEKLAPKYRQIIELRYFEELSYEEISEKTGLPVGTVKATLYRAKELLYNLYNPKKDYY